MRLPALMLAVFLLEACSVQTPQPGPTIADWEQHHQQLAQLSIWSMEGKLGYRDSRDGGSAWVNWQQSGVAFELQLHGPFGAGATQISGDADFAALQRGDRETIYAPSPAALTEQLFGWQWPVDQLQYWVKGIPAPNAPLDASSHNSDGTLATLDQANWQLTFSQYQQVGAWVLPGRIRGNSGEYSFTLVIKNWQPDAVVR